MTVGSYNYMTFNLESNEYLNCLQISKTKVVAMPEVHFYDLWKVMDAARFFSLVDLSSFSSTYETFSHDALSRLCC